MSEYEDEDDTFYFWWKKFDTDVLMGMRYDIGIRLRSTYPRPAFPDYLYGQVRVINRILNERGAS